MSRRAQSNSGRDQPGQANNRESEQARQITFFVTNQSANPLAIAAIEIQAVIYVTYNLLIAPERLHNLALALVELNMDRYLKLCARLRLQLIQTSSKSLTIVTSVPQITEFVMRDDQFAAALERFVFLYAFGK